MGFIRQELSENKPVIWYSGSNIYLPEENTMSEETNQGLPEWITTTEAAEIMGVVRDTVAEYCRRYNPESADNKIICKKIGRDWWVLRESAETFKPDDKNRGRPRGTND